MVFIDGFLAVLIFSMACHAFVLTSKPFGPSPVNKVWSSQEAPLYEDPHYQSHPETIALRFLQDHIPSQNGFGYRVQSTVRTQHSGVTHLYAKQTLNGRVIENGDMSVHIDAQGGLVSASSSFYEPPVSTESGIMEEYGFKMDPRDVLRVLLQEHLPSMAILNNAIDGSWKLEPWTNQWVSFQGSDNHETWYSVITNVQGVVEGVVPVASKYLIVNGVLVSVYEMEVQLSNGNHWLRISSCMKTGKSLRLIDWVSHFINQSNGFVNSDSHRAPFIPEKQHHIYRAYPFPVMDPLMGERALLKDPHDLDASPLGWHQSSRTVEFNGTTTAGNNVWAQHNPLGRSDYTLMYRPRANATFSSTLLFDYVMDEEETLKMVDAAVTNLFVRINYLHDIFYHAGFNEKAGNFQDDNFDRGGEGRDAVIAHAQDGSSFNNADFATPPDGRSGRMRMFLWNIVKPVRDGDFDNAIITHEFAHGVTNRMTGGPANANCLSYGLARGMGEGWGDAFALFFGMNETHTDKSNFNFGTYVYGSGFRNNPYSTNMETNNYSYASIRQYNEEHDLGEIWATFLYEMYWSFVNSLGAEYDWSQFKKRKAEGTMPGNFVAFQLVVDALQIQPCRPNFLEGRDAILAADKAGFQGKHQCLIWTAFAKRGMGIDALPGGQNGWSVPAECRRTAGRFIRQTHSFIGF